MSVMNKEANDLLAALHNVYGAEAVEPENDSRAIAIIREALLKAHSDGYAAATRTML